jgi:hypothetical protein
VESGSKGRCASASSGVCASIPQAVARDQQGDLADQQQQEQQPDQGILQNFLEQLPDFPSRVRACWRGQGLWATGTALFHALLKRAGSRLDDGQRSIAVPKRQFPATRSVVETFDAGQ